jgi:hypothetical protein
MKNYKHAQGGFIGMIILIIVALIGLKLYYHIDVISRLETFSKTPEMQKLTADMAIWWDKLRVFYNTVRA